MSSILDIQQQQQQQPQPQHPQHCGHPTTAEQQKQVLSSETEHLKQTMKVSLFFFFKIDMNFWQDEGNPEEEEEKEVEMLSLCIVR